MGSPTPQNEAVHLFEQVETTTRSVSFWEPLFYCGLLIALLLFTYKLLKLHILFFKNPKRKIGNLHIITISNSKMAFSFLNYIFLGDCISNDDKDIVLTHETVHAEQKHTLDLLLFEVLRILFWFNPMLYLYHNSIVALHEYIADAKSVKAQNRKQFYENLLAQVFDTQNMAFINPFFKQSLIKKRIVMLSKSKSKQIHVLKYLLLIPLLTVMFIYTSCSVHNKLVQNKDLNQFT